MTIQKYPINREGKATTPVAWEQGCLEEVCGSCSMLINGVPRQSCTTLIESIIQETGNTTIVLAPFTKFPLIRDLVVDRTKMFEALKKVIGWISVDGTWDTEENGPKQSPEVQEALYKLSTCMTCGCCSESCPQVSDRAPFMGPAAMSQIRLFNANPTGALQKSERLRAALDEDGIAGCGNAQKNGVTVLMYGVTVLMYGVTVLMYGVTVLMYGVTVPVYGIWFNGKTITGPTTLPIWMSVKCNLPLIVPLSESGIPSFISIGSFSALSMENTISFSAC